MMLIGKPYFCSIVNSTEITAIRYIFRVESQVETIIERRDQKMSVRFALATVLGLAYKRKCCLYICYDLDYNGSVTIQHSKHIKVLK